ncbi:hypothetical protein niasHT_023212 [Heterodera trifolii]|uniref:Lipocalin domain-containing protein n=1 Tax=Heterodera trifolii TaxID=157864 RepID=A0ABD2JD98_9BILA
MPFLSLFSSVSAFALLSLLSFSSSVHHFHHNHHSDSSKGHNGHHQQKDHQTAQEIPSNSFPCACGGHSSGGENARWMNGMPANGVPLFLFPDNVLRLVGVVLRSENAFHRDNNELARHLFHLLAHQFPRKWFIVGIGTMPSNGANEPKMWAREGMDALNGTVQLQSPPGYGSFPFLDGRRFQRENGSKLWYFVYAVEPMTDKAKDGLPKQSLAKCLSEGCPSRDNFVSLCANNRRQLGTVVEFDQSSEMSIFASEPLTIDTETMALTKEAKECLENEGDEKRRERRHLLAVAAPEGEKEMIGNPTAMSVALFLFSLSLSNIANGIVHFVQFDMGHERSLRFPRQHSAGASAAPSSDAAKSAPLFQPISNDLPTQLQLTDKDKENVEKATSFTNSLLERLGLAGQNDAQQQKGDIRRQPPVASYQTDELAALGADLAANRIDLHGLASGQIPGLAPIPVPGFAGPQDAPTVPGVNTIPGLSNFNYIVGQLVPQMIPPTNTLLGSSISRLLPKDATKNLAKNVFRAVHPAAENVDVARMMGRWFQVINSPHVIREACTVSHFGALTNNTYSATFTILKFYREGNSNGPPRFSLGYGFKAGDTGQFLLHSSNSPDAEPFWVIKLGPLNEYNQYDYAVVSNWVRYPVFVIARDPERFHRQHMKKVLQFLEDNNYINVMTKAFNLISPVDYSQCQYTPTFSGAGR